LVSNLRRSKRTVGRRIVDLQERVRRMQKRPAPRRIGNRVVTTETIAPGAVTSETIAPGAVPTDPEVIEAIETAQATADGKNKIYRQTEQPSIPPPPGVTYTEGDLWFDTNDDNKFYRYTGSIWDPFTLGNNALASISASKLTAGTIDASVITVSNINAGNITTGTLNSITINSGTPVGGLYPFSVSSTGTMRAVAGSIAGWTISANTLEADNTSRIQLTKEVPITYGNGAYHGEPAVVIFDGVTPQAIGYLGSYKINTVSFEGSTGGTWIEIDNDGLDAITLQINDTNTAAANGMHLTTYTGALATPVQAIWMEGYAGDSTRNLQVNASGRLVISASDASLKENIEPLESVIDKIDNLNPVTFYWKDKYERGKDQQIGLIAQELEEVFPSLVGVNFSDNKKTILSEPLIFILIKAVQELNQKIEKLEKGMTNE